MKIKMQTMRAVAVGGAVLVLTAGIFFTSTFHSTAQLPSGRMRSPATNSFLRDGAFAGIPNARLSISNLLNTAAPSQSVTGMTQAVTARMPYGTYWSLQGLQGNGAAPLPLSPFGTNVPVYALGSNHFVFDDRSVNYAALNAQAQSYDWNNSTTQIFSAGFDSAQDLWLSIPSGGLVDSRLTVMVHNTLSGMPYTILTKESLEESKWKEEQLCQGAPGNSTITHLARNGRSNLFVWARSGNPSGVIIVEQPMDQDVLEGDTVTFSVTAIAPTTLSYQWACNGTNIPGATSRMFSINNVHVSDSGTYSVIVSDGGSSVESRAAQLTVEFGTGFPWLMVLFGDRQEYTFQEGVTYYIASPVHLFGTTRFSGGTVIKFDPAYTNSSLIVMGSLVCDSIPYYPAILTSIDDHTAGAEIWWATRGYPITATNGAVYLDLTFAESAALDNVRLFYADCGVTTPRSTQRLEIWNSQIIDCQTAIEDQAPGGTDCLRNVLIAGCTTAFSAGSNAFSIEAEQATIEAVNFLNAPAAPDRIGLTNSIVRAAFTTGAFLLNQNSILNPTGVVFQVGDAGGYYLAENSIYLHTGTTNIHPRLFAQLRNKTTHPPISFPPFMELKGDMTWFPQAPREGSGPPDLGYHYDALDYTVAELMIADAKITVLPGTAIGCRQDYTGRDWGWTLFGIDLFQGSSFIARGTPERPITVTDIQLVQEGFEWTCIASFVPDYWPNAQHSPPPTLDFRFVNSYVGFDRYHVYSGLWENDYFDIWSDTFYASNDSLMNWTMRDGNLHGGKVNLGHPNYFWYRPDYVYGSGSVTWLNNLFENVSVNLDPTLYQYGVNTNGLNCDLTFEARHNMFLGGLWFGLEPIPATGGNWLLADNLFHKTDFVQDTNMALDFHHNAYWPRPAGELTLPLAQDSSRLQTSVATNGLNEVALAAPPPYQVGPYGNYYLPNSTPLYHAGSRTPGEAGLAHYTTRLDQIKEGDEFVAFNNHINIGLHYVATTNSNSTLPKDTDGDGIPDYLENWHGDYDYASHTADETDWQNAMTDGATLDSDSWIYDGKDLDGDGLTGAAEKLLGTNPRVRDNPLDFSRMQLPMIVSGLVTIPLAINTNAAIDSAINLMINGTTKATRLYQTNGTWFALWDTTSLANGLYTVSFEVDPNNDGNTSAAGSTFMNVQNAVCFPDNVHLCGEALYVHAQTIDTKGFWEMEIYDVQGNLFTNLTGSVDGNGFCDFPDISQEGVVVSLLDTNGDQLPSSYYDVVVITHPATGTGSGTSALLTSASSGSNTGRRRYFLSKFARDYRNWVVAYMPIYGAITTGGGAPVRLAGMLEGAAQEIHDSAYGANDAVINQQNTTWGYPYTFTLENRTDWNQLINLLRFSPARNFVYFGHGGPNIIGANKTLGATCEDVQQFLHNPPDILDPSAVPTNYPTAHPYRFVFLDGCNTARGNWPQVFGIPNQQISETDFNEKYKIRPRAFLGWATITGQHIENTMPADHEVFYNGFWNAWSSPQHSKLQDAIDNANPITDPRTGNIQPCVLSKSIILYGCPTLPFYE